MKFFHQKTHSMILTIASIVAVCMILAVALFAAMGSYFVNEFRSYIINSEITETEVAANLLDNDFDTLITMMYNALFDAENTSIRLRYQSGELNTLYRSSVEKMQSVLSTMEASLDFANDMRLYFITPKIVISSSSAGSYDSASEAWINAQMQSDLPSVTADAIHLTVSVSGASATGRYSTDSIISSSISLVTVERYLKQFVPDSSKAQYILFMQDEDNMKPLLSAGNLVSGSELSQIGERILGSNMKSQIVEIKDGNVLVSWKSSAYGSLVICQVSPLSMLDEQVSVYRTLVLWVCAAFAALIGLVGFTLSAMIKRPLDRIHKTISQVEKGCFTAKIAPTWSTEFQMTFDHFNKMTAHIQRLIEQEYELRLLNARSEIKQLQCQINPHFLYNSYFTLRGMLADEDYESAQEMSDVLGQYMRYITNSGADWATLDDEVHHALLYMRIQQIRFGNRIEIRCESCPEGLEELHVPRLILQPLIENAFEHGLKQKTEDGILWFHFHYENDSLDILVEDNGSATQETIEQVQMLLIDGISGSGSEGIALGNIARRLKMVYGDDSALQVSLSELGGFCAQIHIGGIVANGKSSIDR